MKENTYYSRNREKVLERIKKKRENEKWEEQIKRKEYNRKYYLEILKDKKPIYKPVDFKQQSTRCKKDYSLKIIKGSFIINFD